MKYRGMLKKNRNDLRAPPCTAHNLHANHADNAGDCTSRAHSSLPWRRLGRFFAATVLTGFVLNEFREMAQMFAYVETAGHS